MLSPSSAKNPCSTATRQGRSWALLSLWRRMVRAMGIPAGLIQRRPETTLCPEFHAATTEHGTYSAFCGRRWVLAHEPRAYGPRAAKLLDGFRNQLLRE